MDKHHPVINNDGCIDVINVNETQIVRPAEGESISLSCDVEKPCFTIRNGYFRPTLKCYTVRFPNAITVKSGDIFKVCIRIPRTIKGKHYEYQIDTIPEPSEVGASAFMRGTEDCEKFNEKLDITLNCGWLELEFTFMVGENDLGDVCEFEYSICFETLKLVSLTKECAEWLDTL